MHNLLSIWLIPQQGDEEYLRRIIDSLSKKYDSPSFIPHLTLFPEINFSLDETSYVIENVFKNQHPFEIIKLGIGQSENFWKTVFIEFELSETLKNLFEKLSTDSDNRNISTFKPHMSLVYKNLPTEERIKVAQNIQTKDRFMIDRVFVNAAKEGDDNFNDIENWRNPYEKKLT